jgi:hypothetical protein
MNDLSTKSEAALALLHSLSEAWARTSKAAQLYEPIGISQPRFPFFNQTDPPLTQNSIANDQIP